MLNTALKYFLEVVNHGSLTTAAQTLHVAPSAVSRMIRKLEDEYATVLFDRSARGMVLTESGQLMAAYARRAHLDAERARSDVRDLGHVGQRLVKISANQAFGGELLPRLIGDFRKKEPSVRFQLEIRQSEDINRRVREGKDDIGVGYSLSAPEGVQIQHVGVLPVYAVMRPDHPLADRKRISMQEVAAYPVALMGQGSTIRFIVDLCCMHESIALNVVMTSNNIGTLQTLSSQYGPIIFAGKLTVLAAVLRGELVALPLTNEDMHKRHFHIQTMLGRELPPSVMRIVQEMIRRVTEAA
ncbi:MULTISPECIES: LysR family transcriptional regulator [unclassified Achromobacter]|uniref:LysR family transcriptional regulator n=1 Tax=unclassified Achromobacter TaxID=2626865 RepID=UPI000B51544E|nr:MULTISPECIES: LysR family transcriptional regulator [unclassified Achromobacter]OWT80599.1 LysR family transcriptional regulator [Achromobacter sp. HZ34]OWT82482.1 LysR family transcriptional regulator [Achromobacter sp. HZ28]